jgi:magnesium-protoporphyrin O-methyltransferase
MAPGTYAHRREELLQYFDRTAVEAWEKLTSDAPVSRIRATVRAGRDRMRDLLLSYLPRDLHGQRLLDAGCGTGALAVEAAQRGADVVAVDLSPTLVELARERTPEVAEGRIDFRVGDMASEEHGDFDWVIAMDSLIHYQPADMVDCAARLAARARRGVAFTFAPSTPALQAMHVVGRTFRGKDRAPDIVPVSERSLRRRIAAHRGLRTFEAHRSERVKSGFYTSQTLELVKA